MDHHEAVRKFEHLMLKEADHAREVATELEALAPSLTTENSRQLAQVQIKASHKPVSYTHLDVYKRQHPNHPIGIHKDFHAIHILKHDKFHVASLLTIKPWLVAQFLYKKTKSLDHEAHEVSRRYLFKGFLCVSSCPWWLFCFTVTSLPRIRFVD